ncbi:MAG: N-acetylneuraminate synthase family protein [Candidatus Omnitrophica bacterium]|nr:N-acetylneuraminate synthase family protein [Candidatus Omnitrophota bacterium]
MLLDWIHEFDYLRWFFGQVGEVFCYTGTTGTLDVEVEDYAEVLLRFDAGVVANVHLDYLQRTYRRSCEIIGAEGVLIWDYIAQTVTCYGRTDRQVEVFTEQIDTERNQMFLEERMNGEGVFRSVSVIADMALSYEGSYDLALATVEAAAEAHAGAINFQIFLADELAVPGYHYYPLYTRLELPPERWASLITHAHQRGLKVTANVFGAATAMWLAEAGVDAFKVHAADVGNRPFLQRIGALGKPVLLSAGGSTLGEISHALRVLQQHGAPEVALLAGVQNTPTAVDDTHLARIRLLKERFGLPVGYADHLDADAPLAPVVPLLAIAAGADFVEKHITLARALKRGDYVSALNPDEFAEFVLRLHEARRCVGVPGGDLGEGELSYREGMKKRVVARRSLEAGHALREEDLTLLRTDEPSDLWTLEHAVGRAVSRTISQYGSIGERDLSARPDALKRLVAVLLCRASSSRLYAKPLQRVGDKTILEHLIGQIRLIPRLDEIILAISEGPANAGFVKLANQLDLDYVIGDEEDGLSRMLRAAEFARADTVFRVTTENPFLHIENINQLIETHAERQSDLTYCDRLPEGTFSELVELSALRRSYERGTRRHRSAWVNLYIREHPEQFRIATLLPPEELQRPEIRLTVDYPEDLIVARKVYEAFDGRMPIPIRSIIRFLDEHPEIKAINQGLEVGALPV